MRDSKLKRFSRLTTFLVICAFLMIASKPSNAQYTPIEGVDHATKAGTGFSGVVNSVGGYNASVPLDFPEARGDLPIPLQVAYGGNQVGAAGLGWDVPLSYILRSVSAAKRRPSENLLVPEKHSMMLNGQSFDLIRNAANTAWVTRRGDDQIEVRTNGDGLMVVYDGEGRTYNFSSQSPLAGGRLVNGNMFLLRSIVGAAGGRVDLAYGISAPALPGGGTGVEINLSSVTYNPSPTTVGCFKNKILLVYDEPVPPADGTVAPPLSLSIINDTVIARVRKLTSISVRSRGICALSEKILSTYNLVYQADPDTKRPQLKSVTMTGQQDTPERYVSLPVATYSYGSVVDPATNKIAYERAQNGGPRAQYNDVNNYSFGINNSRMYVRYFAGKATIDRIGEEQTLTDITGDGRLDFIGYQANGAPRVRYPAKSGLGQFSYLPDAESSNRGNITYPQVILSEYGLEANKYAVVVKSITGQQQIDMNGDGRLDVVSNLAVHSNYPNVLSIYFNFPDPSNPEKSIYEHVWWQMPTGLPAHISSVRGIGSKVTVPDVGYATCYRWKRVIPVEPLYEWQIVADSECPSFPASIRSVKKTITESELRDINGDGYPDLVYNASPVALPSDYYFDTSVPPAPGEPLVKLVRNPADIKGSRDVWAYINIAGPHLKFVRWNETNDPQELFAPTPILLEASSAAGCGVGRHEIDRSPSHDGDVNYGGVINEVCGFQDINGDGIADRVTTQGNNATGNPLIATAKLGTGNLSAPYSDKAVIKLPGALSRTHTFLVPDPQLPGETRPSTCAAGSDQYTSIVEHAMQDINGDGIPDYLRSPRKDTRKWLAAMGTGTGFAPEVEIDISYASGHNPKLSEQRIACVGNEFGVSAASVYTGLYDLDGSGQPEIVSKQVYAEHWNIFQLKSPLPQDPNSRGVPAAGRLVKIENGYGSATTIAYSSAKQDGTTRHDVPFPETVVSEIGTIDTSTGVPLLSSSRYAYGGAEMIFDPAYDSFRFPGYRRVVEARQTGEPGYTAIITDSFGLEPFNANMDAGARFERYLKVGRISHVTALVGTDAQSDPYSFLSVNIDNDPRRVSGAVYDWNARLLPAGVAPANSERCIDMMYPYDYQLSLANQLSATDDVCTHHGFMFQTMAYAWRGTPGTAAAASSSNTVKTSSTIDEVDDYGRVTKITNDGDLIDNNDNLCTQTTYASPTGTKERVLNAPSSRTTTNCGTVTLSESSWEYDTSSTGVKLPAGKISKGLVTAQTVSRRNATTGSPIMDANGVSNIRLFDIAYDANGNPASVKKTRDDGATSTVNFTHDPFALVVVSASIDATNADGSKPPIQTSSSTIDPITMNVLSVTDAVGMVSSNTYDGFGRALLSKVKPVGGIEGVLSSTTYNSFVVGQTSGRTIVQKVFPNPVPVANVGSAPGRISTVFLDSLGRGHSTEVALGADYSNAKMIVGKSTFDQLGRVKFQADPFPSTESFATAYGTTHHFNADGTLRASIRGYGEKPWIATTDESTETYPTHYSRTFSGNTEALVVQGPDALNPGSPQWGVRYSSRMTALGRVTERATINTNAPMPTNIELSSFSYDLSGQLASMTRYQDAGARTNAVTTSWTNDSLGQVIKLEEPGVAAQHRSYSTWGDLNQVQWHDAVLGSDRRSVMQYDALGRLTRSEDRTNGVVDAATVNTYLYDTGVNNAVPMVTATNVLGRLAKASSPTSTVAFSYDGLGRVNARTYVDISLSPAKVYVEKHEINGDGSPKTLSLLLPDNAFKVEKIDYAYDSAGRNRSVKYNDGVNRDLFTATGAGNIDVFGRIRQAQYGVNTLTADYADLGRRLLNSVKVVSPAGASREVAFPTIAGLSAFDPIGRERVRRESKNGVALAFDATSVYDKIGRLQTASLPYNTNPASTVQDQRFYTYDDLGNILQQTTLSSTPASLADKVTLSYDSVDRDRICSIGYGAVTPPAVCNVKYDGVGNVIEMPTRENGLRTLTYFANGSTKSITQGTTVANYKYDAFGEVQQLTLDSTTSADTRRDKHFGSMLTQRTENGVSVLTRKISGPGLMATRHGPTGEWTYTFGEQRGNKFVTDQSGAFVQDMAYQPFGVKDTVLSDGVLPGSTKYQNAQWNGGDALAALNISQLGARMYDPVIGRFLSRDPLVLVRTAATSNAYAFANNDPVNLSDPTGLWSICFPTIICGGKESDQPPPPGGGGGGGGGGARGGGGGARGGGGGGARGGFDAPPEVVGMREAMHITPAKVATAVAAYAHGLKEAAPEVALDMTPVYGTYRSCTAGDTVGCILGAVGDAILVGKFIGKGISLQARIGSRGARIKGEGGAVRSSRVWGSNEKGGGRFDCVAATCARAMRGGLVTADDALEVARLNQRLVNATKGLIMPQAIELFKANGMSLNPVSNMRRTGDYAVLIDRVDGQHMLYARRTGHGVLYLEDAQRAVRYPPFEAQKFLEQHPSAKFFRITEE